MDKEWNRTTRYLVLIIVLVGALWLLYAARMLVGPLIIAALLAYALYPAVTSLTARTRLQHNAAANLVYLLFLIVLVAILVTLVPVIVNQAKRLSLELQSIRSQWESGLVTSVTILDLPLPLDDLLEEFDTLSSQMFKADRVFRVIRSATSNLAWVLVILVTAYYLLKDWQYLREWIISLFPEVYQPDVRRLHGEIKAVWNAYLRGQLLVMLAVGVENLWLQPRIMGRALRLNSGLVFVVVVGALTLGGALMAITAVPLLGSVGVVGYYVHHRILGLPPWSDD